MIPPVRSEIRIRKDDLKTAAVFETRLPAQLAAGEILLAVDRFSMTSNNITYAAFGDRMKYWDFYPTDEGWGIIPVWGYADVLASSANKVAVGSRYYGYYPMASHAVLSLTSATSTGFIEGTPLRRPLAAVYNQYLAAPSGPGRDIHAENLQALLKPLFSTSWLIADFLADNFYFDAATVILSSASSKTAYCAAHALQQVSGPRPRVVGLTSARNVAFTRKLGVYDDVCDYDQVATLDATIPAVYVDMSGDAALRTAIHTHFGDRLAYSCSVGGTHWEALAGGGALPGPRPALFFAPAQIKKRATDWGGAELQARLGAAWEAAQPMLAGSVHVVEQQGTDAVLAVYRSLLAGDVAPRDGHVLRF